MDLATIIGIFTGLFLIVFTIATGGSITIFLHLPSFLIVIGGSTAATLVTFKLSELIGVLKVVKKAFKSSTYDAVELVGFLTTLARKSRREGLLAIDKEISEIDDKYLRTGLEMVVDGTDPKQIRSIMETELNYLMERHKKGQHIFTTLGTYAPAFGMIGTLMGLISMLQKLEDPTQIGGGMAVALITTFYGALAANLIFLPIAGKLKNRSDDELVIKELIIEGVLSIQYGEHPKNINVKLLNFVPPHMRNSEAEGENVKAS